MKRITLAALVLLGLLTTAAAQSSFEGNTCYDDGANCETQAQWTAGWCEAAAEAGAIQNSVESCRAMHGVQGIVISQAHAPQTHASPTGNQNRASAQYSSSPGASGAQGGGACNINTHGPIQPCTGGSRLVCRMMRQARGTGCYGGESAFSSTATCVCSCQQN